MKRGGGASYVVPYKILLIDDDQRTSARLTDFLCGSEIEFHVARTGISGMEAAAAIRPNLVLLDFHLPDLDGLTLLNGIFARNPTQDVIVYSRLHSVEEAVAAIQQGASDFIPKTHTLEVLSSRIRERAEADARLASRSKVLDDLAPFREEEGIIGHSPALLSALAKVERIGPQFTTALITGATGTGKDLLARALHRKSQASGPFITCNCAAIAESLFESELFGYQKGAFTGATQDTMGLIEHANGGTLFLDEIGEIPLTTQAKLLRVLQTREVQRLGSAILRKVDVRIVAATNRDLKSMLANREFRQDLYFRIALLEIHLPPLCERLEDLPVLENHFLDRFAKQYKPPRQRLSRRVQAILERHKWPGNIRELENVISYCCMVSRDPVIGVAALPAYLQGLSPSGVEESANPEVLTMKEMRLKYVQKVLEGVGGNRARAAQILKIGRTTLQRYLKEA